MPVLVDLSGNNPRTGLLSTPNRSNAGSPVSALTPQFPGELVVDTTNRLLWRACGTTTTDWMPVEIRPGTAGTPNNAPTDLALSASTVVDNDVAGTAIGTVSVTDADDVSWSFTILDNAKFQFANGTSTTIGASAALQLSAAGVGALTAGVNETVTIKVTDSGANTYTEAFTITVSASTPPAAIDLNEMFVRASQGQPDTIVQPSLTNAIFKNNANFGVFRPDQT